LPAETEPGANIMPSIIDTPAYGAQEFPGEDISEARRRSQEHRQRCRHLPPLQKGEAERLIAEFLATHGSVTMCPPAYLVPVR
jgi:hypothetical protein